MAYVWIFLHPACVCVYPRVWLSPYCVPKAGFLLPTIGQHSFLLQVQARPPGLRMPVRAGAPGSPCSGAPCPQKACGLVSGVEDMSLVMGFVTLHVDPTNVPLLNTSDKPRCAGRTRCLGRCETGPSQASMGPPAKVAGVRGMEAWPASASTLMRFQTLGHFDTQSAISLTVFCPGLNSHPEEHRLLLGHTSVVQWSLFIYFILFF